MKAAMTLAKTIVMAIMEVEVAVALAIVEGEYPN